MRKKQSTKTLDIGALLFFLSESVQFGVNNSSIMVNEVLIVWKI